MSEDPKALEKRIKGQDRTGTVNLRDFDRGVVITMGAVVDKDPNGEAIYIIKIPDVDGPPGLAGVPVIFSHPEDVFAKKRVPCIVVQRDSISPAMNRWQSVGHEQYKAPGEGALVRTVTAPSGAVLNGFDRTETLRQAIPYDIGYTIMIYSYGRDAQDRLYSQRILDWVSRVYQPYSLVYLQDSIQDWRSYQAYMEGIAVLDDILNISERAIGFALTLRVEGELDAATPEPHKTVTSGPSITIKIKPKG